MKIAACVITHERLPLSLLTIRAALRWTPPPFVLVVADSGSSGETVDALRAAVAADPRVTFLPLDNVYPGRACNVGWEAALAALPEADVLVRLDNDVEVQRGWTKTVECALRDFPDVGTFGLLDMIEEGGPREIVTGPSGVRLDVGWGNTGGNVAIRRELWDAGVRWDERRWPEMGGRDEGGIFSRTTRRAGWELAHVFEPIAVHHGHRWCEYEDYYARLAVERGYDPDVLRAHFDACEERVAAWQT